MRTDYHVHTAFSDDSVYPMVRCKMKLNSETRNKIHSDFPCYNGSATKHQ